MDYTLLTAAHLRRGTSAKMDARREQEYYERATETSRTLENLRETAVFPASLAQSLLETVRLASAHARTLGMTFGYGSKAR